ncbi:MAG: alpha/beta hydrolase [Candidatus Omnitrophica bacterium]|nr:alpha/beta hydrolase [Candidatus Omnitrophota bacterium]
MKNRSPYIRLAGCACAIFLLSGCASLPLQSARTYFADLYKRIPYKTEGHYRVIDIFYATDRNIEDAAAESPAFGRALADKMTFGTLNVRIDPDVTIGKMLPNRLKRRGTIGVQEVGKLNDGEFIKKLSETVAASPHKSLLVMVFGYKDNFEATAIKASYFAYLLDVNTPVLLFDWPGDQSVSIGGYKKAHDYAKSSGPYLGELLTKVAKQVKPEKIWVVASSLGCQVVCDAFDHMHKDPDLADTEAEIDHVVLAAPDVGQKEFDEQFKHELAALSKKLTTYVSANDGALLMSGFINGEKRLGRHREKKQDQMDETKDILYLKSLEPDRITLVDVTPINKASYGHGYYLESPEFYDDFYMRILGKSPNANRRLYLLKFKDGTDYWVLR